jgi:hypothetical protein
MLDAAIGCWKQQRGAASVVPPNQVRRSSVFTAYLLHLAHTAGLTDPVTLDDQFVSNIGEHVQTPFRGD